MKFVIEQRGPYRIIVWDSGGCQPASIAECELWDENATLLTRVKQLEEAVLILEMLAAFGLSSETAEGTPTRTDREILDDYIRLSRHAIGAKERPRGPFISAEKLAELRRRVPLISP